MAKKREKKTKNIANQLASYNITDITTVFVSFAVYRDFYD